MVRPRVVDEGKPITEDDSDEEMHSSPGRPSPPPMPKPKVATSSLARASKGKLPVARPTRTTRVVIGGESSSVEDPMLHHEETDTHQHYAHQYHPQHHQHHQHTPIQLSQHLQTHRTHFEIGADERETVRMEGVSVHDNHLPLVVIDGANIAYAYAEAMHQQEPNVMGLYVAADFFRHVRVRIVLKSSWLKRKPQTHDPNQSNAFMETDQHSILTDLKDILMLIPPTDDDDAYAISTARRGKGFILSNDLFRDAQGRDPSLGPWLINGEDNCPGRISFTYVDVGKKDNYGDPLLDIVPNPRHPLVEWLEKQHSL